MTTVCADASAAAGEALGGTGIVATRWLCVESRRPWGHDAVETGFEPELARWLGRLDAKVLAIRRPARTGPLTVLAAETTEERTTLRRLELDRIDDLPLLDPWLEGAPLDGQVFLVCAHGRRDACCSRLGLPAFRAIDGVVGDRAWQCSHTGGHRFAANVVALPLGITLGRVAAADAGDVVRGLDRGVLPLESYRGRSAYAAAVQAAEVAVRRAYRIDELAALRLAGVDGDDVSFDVAGLGLIGAEVVEVEGPTLPKSCGADPEPVSTYTVTLR